MSELSKLLAIPVFQKNYNNYIIYLDELQYNLLLHVLIWDN